MTMKFDTHAINHMAVAVQREMTPKRSGGQPETDTLFMGGGTPSPADEIELGLFGQSKNYKIVFSSFEPSNVAQGPIGFRAVVTDGIAETLILINGRLWKRDRRSPAVLLFPDAGVLIKMSAKGRLMARPMGGNHHDEGYELALSSVRERAARAPGHIPILAPIGSMPIVLDMRSFADTFAAAA